jgi:hypothetical protein
MTCIDGHERHLAPMGGGPCVRCGRKPPVAKRGERPATPRPSPERQGKPASHAELEMAKDEARKVDWRKRAAGDE